MVLNRATTFPIIFQFPVMTHPIVALELSAQTVLSEETRKDRKHLLLSSASAIAVGVSEIVPTEISALGIKFSAEDRVALLWVIGAVILYLLLTFVVHASLDLLRWYDAFQRYIESLETKLSAGDPDSPALRDQLDRAELLISKPIVPLALTGFEIGLPIAVAIVAMFSLLVVDI